jgi:hypothetical protein
MYHIDIDPAEPDLSTEQEDVFEREFHSCIKRDLRVRIEQSREEAKKFKFPNEL